MEAVGFNTLFGGDFANMRRFHQYEGVTVPHMCLGHAMVKTWYMVSGHPTLEIPYNWYIIPYDLIHDHHPGRKEPWLVWLIYPILLKINQTGTAHKYPIYIKYPIIEMYSKNKSTTKLSI
jgi:hypothetical protein